MLRHGGEAHVEASRYVTGRELAAPHELKYGAPPWFGNNLQRVQLSPSVG